MDILEGTVERVWKPLCTIKDSRILILFTKECFLDEEIDFYVNGVVEFKRFQWLVVKFQSARRNMVNTALRKQYHRLHCASYLKLGTWNFIGSLIITSNMATERDFEVTFNKFNVLWICTNGNSTQKWTIKILIIILTIVSTSLNIQTEISARSYQNYPVTFRDLNFTKQVRHIRKHNTHIYQIRVTLNREWLRMHYRSCGLLSSGLLRRVVW
jgi:hypothetical protein